MDEPESKPKRTHPVSLLRRSTVGGRPHHADEREVPRLRRDRLRAVPRQVKTDSEADIRRFRRIERAERIGSVVVVALVTGLLLGMIALFVYTFLRLIGGS